MTIKIYKATALVRDKPDLERLLGQIPEADELRPYIGKPFVLDNYDPETKQHHWLGSDGEIVVSIVVKGITSEDAAKLKSTFKPKNHEFAAQTFAELIAKIVGAKPHIVN